MAGVVIDRLTVALTRGDYVVKPLDGFTAQASDAELAMLLGPSGSGKTTLLSCLAAILRPTSGSVVVNGVETTRLNGVEVSQYRRETVGIVFQAFNLLPAFSAVENVMAPLRVAGLGRREARRRALDLLKMVGLEERTDHRPGSLSGGQQQRVAIARALAHDPPVIIADEPTAHLDYVQVEGVARLLRSLACPGRVVIVSTHDERLIPLADRVIHLGSQQPVQLAPPTGVHLAPGEVLFLEGQPSDFVWLVEEGTIDLYRVRADGSEHQVLQARAGQYFGDMGPLLGIPRSASARAATAAVVSAYKTGDFKQRLKGQERPVPRDS
jgi:putative ABC transport system ATP-binding protein